MHDMAMALAALKYICRSTASSRLSSRRARLSNNARRIWRPQNVLQTKSRNWKPLGSSVSCRSAPRSSAPSQPHATKARHGRRRFSIYHSDEFIRRVRRSLRPHRNPCFHRPPFSRNLSRPLFHTDWYVLHHVDSNCWSNAWKLELEGCVVITPSWRWWSLLVLSSATTAPKCPPTSTRTNFESCHDGRSARHRLGLSCSEYHVRSIFTMVRWFDRRLPSFALLCTI